MLAAREKSCGALGEYFGNRVGECWDLQEKIANLKESPVFSYYSTNQGGSNGPSSVDVGYTA